MKFYDLSVAEIASRLRKGLNFKTGIFTIRLFSDLSDLPALLRQLHAEYPLVEESVFADFHVRLFQNRIIFRLFYPDVRLWVDEETPFFSFSPDTALPYLEWGLNWCVASRAHHYLMLHAGVLERNGHAMLLPAWPGSGKSTLCAALCHRGWRLLSDEFALVRPEDLALVPFPRLIPLKNESIAVVRAFTPEAVMGPEYPKTRKGTVCHVRPPADSIRRAEQIVQARWIVFPNFQAGADLKVSSLAKARAFLKLAGNSFNYEQIGLRGFETVASLIDCCDCYLFQYSDLEQAVAQLNALADGLI
ncbi:MAG: HprK-related kinase A [Candidatus Competibacter sp.]|nr:HprK-related kinase A [Candidatus Competibacter sp.]MDS4070891.1 HprK-related kinase A [Candidatus Competibacter sp.]